MSLHNLCISGGVDKQNVWQSARLQLTAECWEKEENADAEFVMNIFLRLLLGLLHNLACLTNVFLI